MIPELQDNKYITFQETSNCKLKVVSFCISVSSERLVLPYLYQQLGMAGLLKFWPFYVLASAAHILKLERYRED